MDQLTTGIDAFQDQVVKLHQMMRATETVPADVPNETYCLAVFYDMAQLVEQDPSIAAFYAGAFEHYKNSKRGMSEWSGPIIDRVCGMNDLALYEGPKEYNAAVKRATSGALILSEAVTFFSLFSSVLKKEVPAGLGRHEHQESADSLPPKEDKHATKPLEGVMPQPSKGGRKRSRKKGTNNDEKAKAVVMNKSYQANIEPLLVLSAEEQLAKASKIAGALIWQNDTLLCISVPSLLDEEGNALCYTALLTNGTGTRCIEWDYFKPQSALVRSRKLTAHLKVTESGLRPDGEIIIREVFLRTNTLSAISLTNIQDAVALLDEAQWQDEPEAIDKEYLTYRIHKGFEGKPIQLGEEYQEKLKTQMKM